MAAVPLRRRLLVLAVAGILPLAIISGVGLYLLADQHHRQAERVGRELARAMATAVDAELGSTVSVLEALATTPTLDRDDLRGFHERAARVVKTQPRWEAVWLADPTGRRLVDTRYPYGTPLPLLAERASFDRVVATRAPVVGSLAESPLGSARFPIRVPVVRRGELRYVLTAVVMPEEIRDVVMRQGVPNDWVISVFDANGRRVARSRGHEANLGGEASPSLRALMASGAAEGFGRTSTLEGERIYTPYSRLTSSRWSVALGIPTVLVDGAVYRSLLGYGGGVALSIGLGIVAALRVARSITRPIADVRTAAQALGRREPPSPPQTPIQEIRDVAAALVTAADERAKIEAEREGLLRKEQQARAAAEAAGRPIAPRTNSWRCSRMSCERRSARSTAGRACCGPARSRARRPSPARSRSSSATPMPRCSSSTICSMSRASSPARCAWTSARSI
jgi:hypothetical protein